VPDAEENLKGIITFCENPFRKIKSESALIKHFQEIILCKDPMEVTVKNIIGKKTKGIIFRLKFQTSKFLELQNVFKGFL